MALTRKFLKAMGIEEEKIDQIIEAHTETVDGLKAEISSSKVQTETEVKKVADLEKQVEELKNTAITNEGKNPWKVKFDALKEEFEGYKAEELNKATKKAKETAYKALLKEAGIAEKRIPAVLKVSDIDAVELAEDGKIKDAETRLQGIKDEWAEFITTTDIKGAKTPTPPENKGSKDDGGNDEAINRIIAQRANLYGEIK